jgi:hypothetical protein
MPLTEAEIGSFLNICYHLQYQIATLSIDPTSEVYIGIAQSVM